MKRFKNILLLFDEGARGEAAVERTATLAKANQARLTVVEVIGELPLGREGRQFISLCHPSLLEDPQEFVVRERQEQLAQYIEPMWQEGIQADIKVLMGSTFLEVTREVLRNGHDLVIMTAEGKSGIKEWLFGATSMHLMRKCPCPVWVMKPARHEHYARILAAVDSDPDDDTKDALNRTIMDLATSLAQLEQSELHIVHAWTMFGETLLRNRAAVSADEMEELLREVRDKHQGKLDQLHAPYDIENLKPQVHLRKGDAAAVIPELAREKQIDLIVMGTVCRTGIAGFIIGNTAETILHEVDCSVLTVKTKDFVSPVTL